MVALELKKNEHLVRKGENTKAIYVVLKGSVTLKTQYNEIPFGTGSVLGIMASVAKDHVCDFVAAEDSLVASYKYESPEDYKLIFEEKPEYSYAFLRSAVSQLKTIYERYIQIGLQAKEISDFIAKQYSEYQIMCSQNGFEVKEVEVAGLGEVFQPEPIQEWEFGYYKDLMELPEKALHYFYSEKNDLIIGAIIQMAEFMTRLVANMDAIKEYLVRAKECLICEYSDLLEIWYDVSVKLAMRQESVIVVQVKVKELEEFLKQTRFYSGEEIAKRMKYYNGVDFTNYAITHAAHDADEENADGEVAEEMSRDVVLKTDFTTFIMKYAGYEAADIARGKELLAEYAKIADIQDYTPEMQKVRKSVTKLFYEIYERAFMRAVNARSISVVMKLFFNFGVLDLQMAGVSHLDELMALSELFDNQWKEQRQRDKDGELFAHVYTAYQWLCLVYRGEKEPSKNEFDVDYTGYLLEQRKNKEITREQENELKRDQVKKVQFEMHNMFMTNNRITYGRITSFCPVLHEKEFIRTIDQLIVSPITINAAIDEIRELDYSVFFREVFFADPKFGIERTEIMKEVLPDVILMPNIGTKAMMWQETAGVKRDTPARFIFPVMSSIDMPDMMLETMGRYRWEICRKILGVRWNDIREKSLTSEFYDYVQFYRKNRDLSQEAKEKVKAELVHAKNNYREVFVADYVSWMKFESQGNFRLNKVSRRIISEYVPFNKEVKKKLEENPMYKELFVKSNIIAGRKREKEKVLFERYVAAGGSITPELEAHLKFYDIQL